MVWTLKKTKKKKILDFGWRDFNAPAMYKSIFHLDMVRQMEMG
jgi:hypothetical protein